MFNLKAEDVVQGQSKEAADLFGSDDEDLTSNGISSKRQSIQNSSGVEREGSLRGSDRLKSSNVSSNISGSIPPFPKASSTESIVPPVSDRASLSTMESMLSRIVQTSEDRISNNINSVRDDVMGHVNDLKQDVSRQMTDQKKEMQVITTRMEELENRIKSSPPSSSNVNGSDTECIIGGFHPTHVVDLLARLEKVFAEISGFKTIKKLRGDVPKVAFIEFETNSDLSNFITTQKSYDQFRGLWAGYLKAKEERMQQKILNKIKRAIIEKAAVDAKSIVVDRSSKDVYFTKNAKLTLVARVEGSTIKWEDSVEEGIRAHTRMLLAERPNVS